MLVLDSPPISQDELRGIVNAVVHAISVLIFPDAERILALMECVEYGVRLGMQPTAVMKPHVHALTDVVLGMNHGDASVRASVRTRHTSSQSYTTLPTVAHRFHTSGVTHRSANPRSTTQCMHTWVLVPDTR